MVSEPDLVKDIMVKNFASFPGPFLVDTESGHFVDTKNLLMQTGEKWKRTRKIVTTCFTTAKMRAMLPLLTESRGLMREKLADAARSDREVDAHRFFARVSLDMVGKLCFGMDIDSLRGQNAEFVRMAKIMFQTNPVTFLMSKFLPSFLSRHFQSGVIGLESANYFQQVASHVIKHRKARRESSPTDLPDDILQALLDASNGSDRLDEEEVIANSVFFMGVGYDTIASLISFACHELAFDPLRQEKLFHELSETFSGSSENVTYDDLAKLPYLDAVMTETLRLHPSDTRSVRTTGYAGHTLEKLSRLHLPPKTRVYQLTYVMQHDPKNYPDPESFRPERFLPDSGETHNPYSFNAFGNGPKICVGMRLAQLISKVVLADVVLNFNISRSSSTKRVVQFEPGEITFKPKSMPLKFDSR